MTHSIRPFSCIPRNLIAAAFFSFGLAAAAAPAALAFDEAEKREIGDIVRDYLIKNPEVLVDVQNALEAKRAEEAKEQAAKALAENGDTIFRSRNQAAIGNPEGDVTVVEFFDYNCGFCQKAMSDMTALLAKDKKLKFVMKELPILSPESVEAHRVSTAVYRLAPEKYAEFHNRLLGEQGLKNGQRAMDIAKSLGLDADRVREAANDKSVNEAFREVTEMAQALGINGTPSYVIGDEVIFGALGYDVLKSKIENVRKCGSTVCS